MPFSMVDNITQWAGSLLSPASSSAGDGTQVGPTVRAIQRKFNSVSTSALLPANGTYTSPWIDTQATGGTWIKLQAFSDQLSAVNSPKVVGSNDNTNANFTTTIGLPGPVGAGFLQGLCNILVFCPFRYWQVTYTNNTTPQGVFELVATEINMPPGAVVGPEIFALTGNPNTTTSNAYKMQIAGVSDAGGLSILPMFGAGTGDGGYFTVGYLSGALNLSTAVTPQLAINGGTGLNSTVMQRTPAVFRGSQFSAAGANTIWQPPSTKKSRLMKYKVEVSADATIAGGAAPINLQFNQQLGTAVASLLPYTSTIPYTHRLVVPGSSASSFLGYDSGWIDLGNGVLGPTAGRALQMGIQVPQSTAAISSPTWTITSNQWESATVGFKTGGNAGAFKLVQTTSNAAAASSVALPALQMVTGNSYFVFFRTTNPAGGAPTVVVTDTALNSYTTGTLVTNASDGANGSSLGVAYVINATGVAANFITLTTSVNLSTVVSAIVIEYAGLGSGGIDAAQVGATGNSTSPASGAYTPATAGDVVFSFMATAATLAAVPTAPAAFVLRGVPFTFATGGLAVADNFGNGALATGQINVVAIGTEE
jgi:hypothetical protein